MGEMGKNLAGRLWDWAGEGWTEAVLHVSATDRWRSFDAWTDAPDPEHPSSLMDRLHGIIPRDAPLAVYEVVLRADGTYRFASSSEVSTLSPARLVIDPAVRCPNHPVPGMPRPAAAEPTGQPTDPGVLREVGALVTEFADRYTAITGHAPEWEPGRTEEEIAAAEARIRARLPEDLRALYRLVGRDTPESGLLGYYAHDSLEELVERYCDGPPGSYGGVAEERPLDDADVVFDAAPPGRIKRLLRNDWWVTFGGNHSGEMIAVDLDPAEHGRHGQVLEVGDILGVPRYLAGSVTAMLTEIVTELRANRVTHQEGDPRLDVAAAFHQYPYREHRHILHGVADLNLAAIVTDLEQPDLVQAFYLNDGNHIDLAVLESLTSLREIGVHRTDTVTPTVSNLPELESLTMDAATVDLAPLTGHPTLWDLKLANLTHPVELDVLATLPRLTRLCIAGLDVPDIEDLGRLSALRVVTVDATQLDRLLSSGCPLPKLAAVRINGRVLLREAVEFRRNLTGTRVQLGETAGTLPAPAPDNERQDGR
ncbi:SMI1/KNR4 family protein [Amycolatopsis minnesotensis]